MRRCYSDTLQCRYELSNPQCVAGAFATRIAYNGRVMWWMSTHLFIKTYYAPLLARPLDFMRGLRAVFGAVPPSDCSSLCLTVPHINMSDTDLTELELSLKGHLVNCATWKVCTRSRKVQRHRLGPLLGTNFKAACLESSAMRGLRAVFGAVPLSDTSACRPLQLQASSTLLSPFTGHAME
jgi:hypothetical protein